MMHNSSPFEIGNDLFIHLWRWIWREFDVLNAPHCIHPCENARRVAFLLPRSCSVHTHTHTLLPFKNPGPAASIPLITHDKCECLLSVRCHTHTTCEFPNIKQYDSMFETFGALAQLKIEILTGVCSSRWVYYSFTLFFFFLNIELKIVLYE